MLSLSLRDALLTSTIVAGACLIAVPASAQSNQGSSTTAQTPEGPGEEAASTGGVLSPDQQAASEEGVGDQADKYSDQTVVTGSLIRNNVDAIPVVSVGAQTIELTQANTAEELLRDLPGMTPSYGSAVNNGSDGGAYVDLYGLGRKRNLVLLDGRRIAPSDKVGAVDTNNIPGFLIKRVDTLTGGASTTYGADAMAGVVNFVMDREFTGFKAEAANQISQKGDGQTYRIDVATGAAFDDNRGNVVFSAGYQNSKPIYQSDRGYSYQAWNADDTIGGSNTTAPGRFSFLGGGKPGNDPTTGQMNGYRQIDPATGTAVGTYQVFNYNPYNLLKTPFRRWNLLGYGRYELSKDIEVYTRGLYSNNEVRTIIAPSGAFGLDVRIPLSNPYMPVGIRNQFCKNNDFNPNVSGIQTISQAECDAAATATDINDPNFRAVSTKLQRRNSDGGPRIATYTTHYYDIMGGLRGKIVDDINWDVSGSYGRSDKSERTQGYWINSRVQNSLWATNKNTCLTAGVPGLGGESACVPLNAFGAQGSITPNMLGYVSDTSGTRNKSNQIQVIGTISGDSKINLPWSDRGIGFAVGADYRRERASYTADSLARAGELAGGSGKALESRGGYRVYEGYGELNVPIASDRKLLQELSLNAGVRYSGYRVQGEGRKMHSWTYKGEANWKPIDALMFRGNYTRAVRAPNVDELFQPVNTGLGSLANDPCSGSKPVGAENANLAKLCMAQGAPASSIGSIANPSASQANNTYGGNINLKPERSKSWGAGVVISPRSWGFSLTADYYHIKIKREISEATLGDVVSGCFTGTYTADTYASNQFCQSIFRDTGTGGLDGDTNSVKGIITQLGNLGQAMTDGVNVQATFRRDLTDKIRLDYSNVLNWTRHSKFKATPVSVNRECAGYYSESCRSIQPKVNMVNRFTFSSKRWLLSLAWRYLHRAKLEPLAYEDAGGADSGIPKGFRRIRAQNRFDLTGQIFPNDHLELTLAVTNLTNQKPPYVSSNIGDTAFNNGNTYPSSYDAIGRMFRASAKIKF